MIWTPQSPDLNPIEMVWDELNRRVKEKQPTSAQHMWELLQDCRKSIPEKKHSLKSIKRMSKVYKFVIKAKGVSFEQSQV
jgi:transposase